jgi:hypothetical protein
MINARIVEPPFFRPYHMHQNLELLIAPKLRMIVKLKEECVRMRDYSNKVAETGWLRSD